MSNWGSIISSLAPEVGEVVGSLAEVALKKASTANKKQSTAKNEKKYKPNNKKTNKKTAPEISTQKDICEKDCICDDIKTKNLSNNSNKIKPISIPLDIKPDELAKYIVYSEILGEPACKKVKNRRVVSLPLSQQKENVSL